MADHHSTSDRGGHAAEAPAKWRLGFWAGGAVLASVFVWLTVVTWRKWGDLVQDFGVQLYLPWKISTGTVLYRDVAYLTGGPLSQYYHAALFKVFGVSLTTVVASNIVILLFLTGLIYWQFYRVSDAVTACMMGLAFLLVFAFGHYTEFGIFNYITPYSHEIVHGLVLSIIALVALSQWVVAKKISRAALAGLCLGLVLLTKPEVFLALSFALAVAVFLCWKSGERGAFVLKSLAALAAAGAIPPLAFFIYFSRHEGFPASARSVLWAWVPLLTTSASDNYFYQWCMGLNNPFHHIQMIGQECVGFAALVAAFAFGLRCVAGTKWVRWVFASELILGAAFALNFHWGTCGYCLPLLCFALMGLIVWCWKKGGLNQDLIFPTLWTAFGVALLAKLGLFQRVWHYGFVLAMPAFLAMVYFLLWQAPRMLIRYRVSSFHFRAVIGLVLLIGFGELLADTLWVYDRKTISVGAGGDRLYTFRPDFRATGASLGQALDWLATNAPANASLAVLPEGPMLNFISRRDNPTGYLRWNIAEIAVFDQAKMDEAFQRGHPDYVILIPGGGKEYAAKPFGQEERFGLKTAKWVSDHYAPVVKYDKSGITIMKKNDK